MASKACERAWRARGERTGVDIGGRTLADGTSVKAERHARGAAPQRLERRGWQLALHAGRGAHTHIAAVSNLCARQRTRTR